jgi:hypothetical protein
MAKDLNNVVKMVEHFIVMKWTPSNEWQVIADFENESFAFNAMNSEIDKESRQCRYHWESNIEISEHKSEGHVVIHWHSNPRNIWASFMIKSVMMPWID